MFAIIMLWFGYPVPALTTAQTLRQYLGLKTLQGSHSEAASVGGGVELKIKKVRYACVCVCVYIWGKKAKEEKTNTCCHQPLLGCSRDIRDAIRLGHIQQSRQYVERLQSNNRQRHRPESNRFRSFSIFFTFPSVQNMWGLHCLTTVFIMSGKLSITATYIYWLSNSE